jgi:hypothetical protein
MDFLANFELPRSQSEELEEKFSLAFKLINLKLETETAEEYDEVLDEEFGKECEEIEVRILMRLKRLLHIFT